MQEIPLPPGQKLYFASDFHLGWPDLRISHERERRLIRWLDQLAPDAAHLFLVGDVFDFWFEYRRVVPRGFVRFMGKIAELSDAGLPISLFGGNHDMWLTDYLRQELGISVYHHPIQFRAGQHTFFVGHGDGLGPKDRRYKLIKRVFTNPFLRKVFAAMHPHWGVGLAHFWSQSRKEDFAQAIRQGLPNPKQPKRITPGRENLLLYIRDLEASGQTHSDFYIFGHRHLAIDYMATPDSRYINLGEWLQLNTYAVYDGSDIALHGFENPNAMIFRKENMTYEDSLDH